MNKGHQVEIDQFKVIGTDTTFWGRKWREAIHIRKNQPAMNRDGGLQLSHTYDQILKSENPGGQLTSSERPPSVSVLRKSLE